MSAVAAAVVGSAVIGGVVASGASSKAAKAQTQAAELSAAEQRAAREQLTQLLAPYTAAGTPALQSQMNLLGIGGGAFNPQAYLQANPDVAAGFQQTGGNFATPEEYAQWHYENYGKAEGRPATLTSGAEQQQAAISQFEQSPMFQALARQGEMGITQNASATGGLRGGNVQGALAQFRPALLNQQIQQQFQNLGGISALGQSSAAGVGAGGMQAANQIGNAYTQAGQAQAGGYLGQANAITGALGQIGGFAAGGGFGGFGGGLPSTSGIMSSTNASLAANPGLAVF